MRIKAFKVKCASLRPGDLFSTQGNHYWEHSNRDAGGALGQKVYIRTEEPCPPDEANDDIFLIKILRNAKEKK